MEILTRGAVHEAFARPYEANPEPGVTVNRQPPAAIDELPPDNMPEGNNVQWIPGYWTWDDEREDFAWVSGLWRDVPPGQRWVPGYWTEGQGGHQWVSGFWTTAEGPDITYLPQPPQNLEQGPNIAAPGDDYFWIPGCWMYQTSGYRWRPGYWSPCYDDWVWYPDCYRWTPRGYVYNRGFWDYRFPRRGVLFAPVYFPRYRNFYHGYRYTPGFSIALGDALVHLWVRPRYCHYFFGNYYGPNYLARGIRPWYRGYDRTYYDPLLTYYRTQYRRQGLDFDDRLNRWHNYYDQYPDRRPPLTVAQTTRFVEEHRNTPHIGNAVLARPLREVAENGASGRSFRTLNEEQRREFATVSQDFRNLERQRTQFESRFPSRDTTADTGPDRTVDRAAPERDFSDRTRFELPQDRTSSGQPVGRLQRESDRDQGFRVGQSRSSTDRSLQFRSDQQVPERPDAPRRSQVAEQAARNANDSFDRFRNLRSENNAGGNAPSSPDLTNRLQNRFDGTQFGFDRSRQPSTSTRSEVQQGSSARQLPSFDSSRTIDRQSPAPSVSGRQEFNSSRPDFQPRSAPQSNSNFQRSQPQFRSESSRSLPQMNRSQPQINRPDSSSSRSAPQFNRSSPSQSFQSRSSSGSRSSNLGTRSSPPSFRAPSSSSRGQSSSRGFSNSSSRSSGGSSNSSRSRGRN